VAFDYWGSGDCDYDGLLQTEICTEEGVCLVCWSYFLGWL
jgi:hypothetical protein